jgi:plastocyanin
MNKYWSLFVTFLIAFSTVSLFAFVNASASISTNSPEEIVQSSLENNNTSNIASDIFSTKEYSPSSSIKNLVVLIPNEGHHGPGEEDEARFIDQSFVPETAVINKGTNVIWFNGDVGHEHDIVVTSEADSTNPIYQTGEFTEFEARNYTFNEAGEFQYADTVEYENGYIMRGNITVTDSNSLQQTSDGSNTVGVLMVPTQDISQYTSDLESRGFLLDGMYNFQDLRGGQSGTGDEQTLIVWRVPPEMQISSVLSQLSEFSSQLPYS